MVPDRCFLRPLVCAVAVSLLTGCNRGLPWPLTPRPAPKRAPAAPVAPLRIPLQAVVSPPAPVRPVATRPAEPRSIRAAAARTVATTTLAVKATIDGADAVRIGSDHIEWVHRSGSWPTEVTLNGRVWNPEQQPRIAGDDLAAWFPGGLAFGACELAGKSGRGEVSIRVESPEAFHIEFGDPADGAAPYEAECRLRDLSWLSTAAPFAVGAETGPADPAVIRISAKVEGSDRLMIYPNRAEWRHGSSVWAEGVSLNGVAWSPEEQQTLRNSGTTAFMPRGTEVFGAALQQLRGRGKVELKVQTDGLLVQFEDPQPGADEYEFVIHRGESFSAIDVPGDDKKRIARMFAAQPRASLPVSRDLPTARDVENVRRAWNRSRLTLAYEEFGRRDPSWDDAAVNFLDREGRLENEQEPAEEMVAAGFKLIDLGCDDPLVAFALARQLSRLTRYSEAVPFALHAVSMFEDLKYPWRASRAAPALLSQLYAREPVNQSGVAYALTQRALAETVEAAQAPLAGDERRALFLELRDDLGEKGLLAGQEPALLRLLADSGNCDPWIVHMLLSEYLEKKAWHARGSGSANTVTDQGFLIYNQLMSQMQAHSVAAWKARPAYPEAAVQMIMGVRGLAPVAGETPRFWFDQAVAAQIDAQRAHHDMLWTLRPRWEGSHAQMLQFGVECLRTGRFDTDVPGMIFGAIQGIVEEGGDVVGLVATMDVADEIRQAMPEIERNKTGAALDIARTRHLIVASTLGWHDEARRRMQELNGHFHDETGKKWSLSSEFLRYDIAHPAQSFVGAPVDDKLEIDPARRLLERRGLIRMMALAGDSQHLAVHVEHNQTKLVTLWTLAVGRALDIKPAEGLEITGMAFSPDSNMLALAQSHTSDAAPRAGRITLWKRSESSIRDLVPNGYDPPYTVDWLPDSQLLALNTLKGVQIVDPVANRVVASTPVLKEWVTIAAVSPVDRLMAVAFTDGLVQIYKIPAAEELEGHDRPAVISHVADLTQHMSEVNGLEFSSDGRTLASSSPDDRSVWLWDVAARQPKFRLPGWRVAFSPDSKRVVTGGGWGLSHQAVLWDVESGAALRRFEFSERGTVTGIAFTADGQSIIVTSFDGAFHKRPI